MHHPPIIAAALIASSAPALADPPSNGASAPAAATPATDPILAYYPPAALANGVGGKATLQCGRTQHGGFSYCEVLSEEPEHQAFGAAAVALAKDAIESPSINLPTQLAASQNVTFQFTPAPPWITPNVLKQAFSVLPPRWARVPSGDSFVRLYPEAAERAGVTGSAVLVCTFVPSGALTNCHAEDETPTGHGFGRAVLGFAPFFRLAPTTLDGSPLGTGTIRIPIRFEPPLSR